MPFGTDIKFKRLAIIGVGLIGGSLARAVRQAGGCAEIIGCGRNVANLDRAVALGVIDRYETDIGLAVKGADMIVVAVPLGAMAAVFKKILPRLSPDATITDVGSAKASVVKDARASLGDRISSFVPGHPIAGTEKSGVEASFAELFIKHCVILTPVAETSTLALQRVRALWKYTGAEVIEMELHHHDEVLAATSHLPHVLAYTLVDTLARMDASEEIFRFAAGGFRDFTRIASSDPVMWSDICLANKDALLRMIGEFDNHLKTLAEAVRKDDSATLIQIFSRAKQVRDRILKK